MSSLGHERKLVLNEVAATSCNDIGRLRLRHLLLRKVRAVFHASYLLVSQLLFVETDRLKCTVALRSFQPPAIISLNIIIRTSSLPT